MRITVTVACRWTVVAAAATVLAALLAVAQPADAAKRTIKVECLAHHMQVHRVAPKYCLMYEHGSADQMKLSHIHWRRWGKPHVRGVAIADLKKYVRSTESYVHYRGRVRIRLWGVYHQTEACLHGTYYTRAQFTFTSGPAAGRRHSIYLSNGCPA